MTSPVPVTGITPIYGIEYLQEGDPAFHVRAKLERNSKKLEALMAARAIAPPAAQDLAAVSGRVTTLENTTVPGVSSRVAALETPGFVALTMLNAWQNYGGAYQPSYASRMGKWVTIAFMVKNGAPGTVMAALPVGYRPAGDLYLMGLAQTGGTSYPLPVVISSAGNISPSPPAGFTNASGSFTFLAA